MDQQSLKIWFAGFYEGEGSVSNDISNRNRLRVSISQNDITPLKIGKNIWGGNIRNRKRITNPSEAMKIICKNKNYKNILRLSTASLLGIPYELIYTSYNKFNENKYSDEILHLSDSIPKSMVVSVNLLEDETCEINVIKMLQLLKVSDDNTPLGIITLKLSIKLEKEKTDNNCILFWNYSRLSSV